MAADAITVIAFLAGCLLGAAAACGALYLMRKRWPVRVTVTPHTDVDWQLIDAALASRGLRAVPSEAARLIAH